MKVYYHADCLLHDPPYEILGKEVPYLENPSRITMIRKTLSEDPEVFEITDGLDNGLDMKECILKVHESEYLEYLESAYDAWVSDGGDEVPVQSFSFEPIVVSLSLSQTAVFPVSTHIYAV